MIAPLSNDHHEDGIAVSLGGIQFGVFPPLNGRPFPFPTTESIMPMLDVMQKYGHHKLDTARIYGGGFSEKLLGDLDFKARGFRVGTKLYPTKSRPLGPQNVPYDHSPEDLTAGLNASLEALRSEYVDTFYLYAPDPSVPYEVTLKAINELHKEGKFRRWGLCRFPAWEVAVIQELCIKNNWVRPSVYQPIYNAIIRYIEIELVPCLRHYGMSIEAAQPTASGLLTSRYTRDMADGDHPAGRRFDPGHFIGRHNRARYWHDSYFDALKIIRKAAKQYGLTELECGLRWLKHHSALKASAGDSIIVCASDSDQLEECLSVLEKEPLPEEVVKAMDEAWEKARREPYIYHD